MPAYIVADTELTPIKEQDRAVYENYMSNVTGIIEKHGGKFLVRGQPHEILEPGWSPHRICIIEFPDMASLKGWYESDEYAPFLASRLKITTNYIVAVEGD